MNSKKQNILIVDDNFDVLNLIQRQINNLNYLTYRASTVNEATKILKNKAIDLLITDLYLPETSGLELLKYTEEHFPLLAKLVITGVPSIENAINSIKSGASDYLIKPFTTEKLHEAINSSLLKIRYSQKSINSCIPNYNENNYSGIIGQSNQFKNLVEIIKRVSNNKANVLIEGESGTGKELIARAIHYKGQLAKMPFIAINCGGIPESLMESELFGYVKGAFTGATESKIGLFQAANGGTLFLDEIGNASMTLQTRLLRVLQEKEIIRIGSTSPEKINVRILSATNNDLYQMVLKGTFREDLYYRINVINIKTTPLRERTDDLLLLLDNFITKYCTEYNRSKIVLDDKVYAVLLRYSWPGNIRELENIIQRMIILGDKIITLQNLPEQIKYHIPEKKDSFKSLKEYEKDQILNVLTAVGNNKTQAAKILQIDRKTLNQKII